MLARYYDRSATTPARDCDARSACIRPLVATTWQGRPGADGLRVVGARWRTGTHGSARGPGPVWSLMPAALVRPCAGGGGGGPPAQPPGSARRGGPVALDHVTAGFHQPDRRPSHFLLPWGDFPTSAPRHRYRRIADDLTSTNYIVSALSAKARSQRRLRRGLRATGPGSARCARSRRQLPPSAPRARHRHGSGGMLTVIGGKLTTYHLYRRVGGQARRG